MKGTFMLGIDVELAWGKVHRKRIDLKEMARISMNVREILDDLFSLLEMYQIPVTWSIVGHLILNHCDRNHRNHLPHSDMPRPNYSWFHGDWYQQDPCSNLQEHPAWYGKDIVDKIIEYVKKSSVPHEIGCHSFSHQQFGDPGCSEELASAEIRKCLELMKREYNILPQVFTFPRVSVGHISILKEFGFVAYTDVPPKLYPCIKLDKTFANRLNTVFSLSAQFLSYYVPYPPHVITIGKPIQGLSSFPVCLGYGKKPLIPLRLITFKAIQGIKRAIRERKIFVMYTHLRNLDESESCLYELQKILSFVDCKRREGMLDIETMSNLSKNHHETHSMHIVMRNV